MNSTSPKRREIALALGVSPAAISQHSRRGMPTSSIEAARAWHLEHVDQVRAAGQRMASSVPRMTAARATAAPPAARPPVPPSGQPDALAAEFFRAARACGPHDDHDLPAPLSNYLRGLLREMSVSTFAWAYWDADSDLGAAAITRLLPRAHFEWAWACDADVPDEDAGLLKMIAAGQAKFEWDPTGPWPRFRDCVSPMPWVALDLAAARRDFEAFLAAQA